MLIPLKEKICSTCSKNQTIESFYLDKKSKDGYSFWCKTCCKEYNRKRYETFTEEYKLVKREKFKLWQKKNKEHCRFHQIKYNYGLTKEQYLIILEKQNYTCDICPKEIGKEKKKNGRAVVDHCHKTGKIRGLLCDNCNRGLGSFQDSPKYLKKAVDYLNERS
jgi:hypothetical protein